MFQYVGFVASVISAIGNRVKNLCHSILLGAEVGGFNSEEEYHAGNL